MLIFSAQCELVHTDDPRTLVNDSKDMEDQVQKGGRLWPTERSVRVVCLADIERFGNLCEARRQLLRDRPTARAAAVPIGMHL